jgi:putative endonuclease
VFCTYILHSESGFRYYIGHCEKVTSRLALHNSGEVKSTAPYRPWKLVGFIEKETRSEAVILEKKLKNFNTPDLERFIKKYFGAKA